MMEKTEMAEEITEIQKRLVDVRIDIHQAVQTTRALALLILFGSAGLVLLFAGNAINDISMILAGIMLMLVGLVSSRWLWARTRKEVRRLRKDVSDGQAIEVSP